MPNPTQLRIGDNLFDITPSTHTASAAQEQAVLDYKRARVAELLKTPSGVLKLSASISQPLRTFMRAKGQSRNWVHVDDDVPIGIPYRLQWATHYLDTTLLDKDHVPVGVRVAEDIGERYEFIHGEEEVSFYSVAMHFGINKDKMFRYTYDPLAEMETQMGDAFLKYEDDTWLSAFASAATASTQTTTVGTVCTRALLFQHVYQVEKNWLKVENIVAGPGLQRSFGDAGFTVNVAGLKAVEELTDTGVLGRILDKTVWYTPYLAPASGETAEELYMLAEKEYLGTMPIRQEMQIKIMEHPDFNTMELYGRQNMATYLHNNKAVSEVKYSITA